MPIYYTENSIRQILGVAAIAVPMNTIFSYNIKNEQEAILKLTNDSPCLTSSLSDCALE